MNTLLIMGLFALYMVAVSLIGLLGEKESPLLSGMKRCWGRARGTLFHFVAHVAVPLVFGVVFVSQGVVQFTSSDPAVAAAQPVHLHGANDDFLTTLRRSWRPPEAFSPAGSGISPPGINPGIPVALLGLEEFPLP